MPTQVSGNDSDSGPHADSSGKEVKGDVDKATNREFLHSQLMIGRWYIDRALDSRADMRRRYLSLARETCGIIERLLPTLALDAEARRATARELALLRARLESVAAEVSDAERSRKSG